MMKKNILFILLTALLSAQSINSNVNSYKTNVVVRPSNDNLEVITYVEIYNRNLQFLKKYNKFGIPFNAFYSSKFPEGIVMNEILTEKQIFETYNKVK